jgi:hypothetical protein
MKSCVEINYLKQDILKTIGSDVPPEGVIHILVRLPMQVIFIPVIGAPFCSVYLDMSSLCTLMKLVS